MASVYSVLIDKINEMVESRTNALSDGALPDYTAYQRICGEIRGLSLAKREIQDLAKLQMEDDDDE